MKIKDKKQKKVVEEAEKLMEMGQESEIKAAKTVMEVGDEIKAEDDKIQAAHLEDLTRKSRFSHKTYKQKLVMIMSEVMRDRIDMPEGWVWDCWTNLDGVGISLRNPSGQWIRRAFKPNNMAKYDLEAVATLCEWSQERFDDWRKLAEKINDEKKNSVVSSS